MIETKNNKNKISEEINNPVSPADESAVPKLNIISWAKAKLNQNLKYIWLSTVVVLVAVSAYFYIQLLSFKKNPNRVSLDENRKLLSQVGQLIVLPENETPTIATVTDSNKLKDQPFFAKAKKGDKVILYPTSKKAILYSPENGKIIEVAPLTIGAPTPLPSPVSK